MRFIHKLLAAGFLLILTSCGGSDGLDWKNLDVQDMQGNSVDMSQFEGERVFLNFWATWCRPCLKEMPEIEILRQQLEQEGYKFVLVSDEPVEKIQAYTGRKSFGFTYLKLNASIKSLGIFSIPQTYIIDRQGKIVKHISEYSDWTSPDKLAMLQSVQ